MRHCAVFLLFVCSMFGIVSIAYADSAKFEPPPCVYNVPATCGYFTEIFSIENLDALRDVAYIYASTYNEHAGGILATSTSVKLGSNPYKSRNAESYFAFAKDKLQEATGSLNPLSIFKTTTTEDPYSGEQRSEQIVSSAPEVQAGLMEFVVPKEDDSLGLSVLVTPVSVIDGKFVKLDSLSVNPFVQKPVTSPVKEKHLVYRPLGIYGGDMIVLYKSKEIQKLDDGSQKSTTLPPPSINGVVPFTEVSSAQIPNPIPTTQSWWSNIWCFIKGIFGRSC